MINSKYIFAMPRDCKGIDGREWYQMKSKGMKGKSLNIERNE